MGDAQAFDLAQYAFGFHPFGHQRIARITHHAGEFSDDLAGTVVLGQFLDQGNIELDDVDRQVHQITQG
ncbi:MAG: hypothetical protein H6R09_376 [Proteobacteria bacterium]|nr:hypothetical protein [Pseudomonadota bacterium]